MRILLFILAGFCAAAAELPKTLLSEDEAEPIHSAIIRKETWTLDPVRHLRAEADKRLHEGPWSVTSDRPTELQLLAYVATLLAMALLTWIAAPRPARAAAV